MHTTYIVLKCFAPAYHLRQVSKVPAQKPAADMDNMDTQVPGDDFLEDPLLHEYACPRMTAIS